MRFQYEKLSKTTHTLGHDLCYLQTVSSAPLLTAILWENEWIQCWHTPHLQVFWSSCITRILNWLKTILLGEVAGLPKHTAFSTRATNFEAAVPLRYLYGTNCLIPEGLLDLADCFHLQSPNFTQNLMRYHCSSFPSFVKNENLTFSFIDSLLSLTVSAGGENLCLCILFSFFIPGLTH